jgi:hypothetical protein
MSSSDGASTMEDLMRMVHNLREENQELRTQGGHRTRFKYPEPSPYDGTNSTLRGFLTQMRAYLTFHSRDMPMEADKVMCAAAFLRGNAHDWFEPIQRDYLTHAAAKQEVETTKIFGSYNKFEKKIKGAFGDPDEERTTKQQLRNLKQRASASDYATKFQQISSHLDWDEGPRMAAFY